MADLKLTHSIINNRCELVGFVVSGKEKDFGGVSDNVTERSMSVQQLRDRGFKNRQISFANGRITELGNFKIRNLPMFYLDNNKYTAIDNSITITSRVVSGEKLLGFKVKLSTGMEIPIKYNNLITICGWFKPTNFQVRTVSKDGKTSAYICGNKGVSLSNIPAISVNDNSSASPKKAKGKSVAKSGKNTVNTTIAHGVDIIDLTNFLYQNNGYLIKFHGKGYTAVNPTPTNVPNFNDLGIGEIAPGIDFNATKLNVNAKFKKPGVVDVNGTNVNTFIYRTKSIFFAGNVYSETFGVAVPNEVADTFQEAFSGSLSITKETNSDLLNPLGQMINVQSHTFFTVSSNNIDLVSPSKNYELKGQDLADVVKQLSVAKLITKTAKKIIKDEKENLSGLGASANTDICPAFRLFAPATLQELQNRGFNLQTGAYEVQPDSKTTSGNSDAKSIEIEYVFAGADTKVTAAEIIEIAKGNKESSKICAEVATIIKNEIGAILALSTPKERIAAAEKVEKKYTAATLQATKKLWMHNASMLVHGNKQKVHTHDASDWAPANSRVKTGSVYESKVVAGLRVKLVNIDM